MRKPLQLLPAPFGAPFLPGHLSPGFSTRASLAFLSLARKQRASNVFTRRVDTFTPAPKTSAVRLSGNRRAVSRRDFVNKWKWRQMTPRERRRALSFSFFLYSCVCTSRAELHDDCEAAKTGITFPFLFFYGKEKGRKPSDSSAAPIIAV